MISEVFSSVRPCVGPIEKENHRAGERKDHQRDFEIEREREREKRENERTKGKTRLKSVKEICFSSSLISGGRKTRRLYRQDRSMALP